jgi:hypothetical protein
MWKHSTGSKRLPPLSRQSRRSLTALLLSALSASLALACLPGCQSTAGLVSALGADTNAVQVNVTSPWGTVEVRRNLPAK